MKLSTIHCFLVPPGKHERDLEELSGASPPKSGKLYRMLADIFDSAETECPTEIVFMPTEDGQQQNDCRDLILDYVRSPAIKGGRVIAERLRGVTTHRSKLGLLVLLTGSDGTKAKLVLSRFPADEGILAEQNKNSLALQFLEKVFVKSLYSYKAAVYGGNPASSTAFWMGRAIDKQIGAPGELADYWIKEFLASDLRTTSAAGTMRLAEALHAAIRTAPDLSSKQELMAVATLAGSLAGKPVSARSVSEDFGLSDAAANAFIRQFRSETLADEQFHFDVEEFRKHAPLRSVEISNGAILTAATGEFDEVFSREQVSPDGHTRFSTEGKVVDERIRKSAL